MQGAVFLLAWLLSCALLQPLGNSPFSHVDVHHFLLNAALLGFTVWFLPRHAWWVFLLGAAASWGVSYPSGTGSSGGVFAVLLAASVVHWRHGLFAATAASLSVLLAWSSVPARTPHMVGVAVGVISGLIIVVHDKLGKRREEWHERSAKRCQRMA